MIISADIEWEAVRSILPVSQMSQSPYGEWFEYEFRVKGKSQPIILFHGGWGKIAAAASTQYVIDHFQPDALINLGTCGGIAGRVERGKIILAHKTIVYDILEQMGDYDEHIRHYTTELDLSFLHEPFPLEVVPALLVSGDRDLLKNDIPMLVERFGAIAGDWESGAIAFVAQRNRVPLLILRGVSDLVGEGGGEAYGNIGLFENAARKIMDELIARLDLWIDSINTKGTK